MVGSDEELKGNLSMDDLKNLNRGEARERLRTGKDGGARQEILEQLSGDKAENVRGKDEGF